MSFSFEQLVRKEAEKARLKNGAIRGMHEGLGLMLEEVNEFQEEVFKKSSKRNIPNALLELVQISAICLRIAEDLGLLRHTVDEGLIDITGKINNDPVKRTSN